ncbi:MAG: ATP-dependent DNA ligase [Nitriliruptorales bacterium]|nr:ATP-dependent DNA ligase [Nitriliruptorales bacterium]
MRLADLVATSNAVGATRSRNEKTELLADLLRGADADELLIAVAWLSGEPRQDRLEVGWAALRDTEVDGATEATLTITEVDAAFEEIAAASGEGSREQRLDLLQDLLSRATRDEQDFLAHLVMRELRQGANAGVMQNAIAAAFEVPLSTVRRAAMLSGDLSAVATAAATGGEDELAAFRLELFRPVEPMLAATAGSVTDALDGLDAATIEAKLDGARVQVHRDGDEVRVFTRNLRDVTAQVPEIAERVRDYPPSGLVMDGEAIALGEDGRPEPFQVTMARFSTEAGDEGPPLAVRFFDVLRVGDDELIDLPLSDRLGVLEEAVPDEDRIGRITTTSVEDAETFVAATLDAGHEGVMVKDLASAYAAGRRGAAWRKVKPVHTLDLVILAAEWGSGRRTGWLSNLHLGAYDPDEDDFVMLGKTFKGLTDEMLTWQTERFLELEERRARNVVHLRPDVVAEIAFDGVQSSPRYPGGLALRFARVKGYRPDKDPTDADTIDTVRAIHRGEIRPDLT